LGAGISSSGFPKHLPSKAEKGIEPSLWS